MVVRTASSQHAAGADCDVATHGSGSGVPVPRAPSNGAASRLHQLAAVAGDVASGGAVLQPPVMSVAPHQDVTPGTKRRRVGGSGAAVKYCAWVAEPVASRGVECVSS